MINKGELIEHVFESHEYYGTSLNEIEKVINDGKICIVEIDITGAKSIYKYGINANYIGIVSPSIDTLRGRVKENTKENTENINSILEVCQGEMKEIENSSFFTHRIVNDDFDSSYLKFKNSVLSTYPILNENNQELLEYMKEKREKIEQGSDGNQSQSNKKTSSNNNDNRNHSASYMSSSH